MENTNPLEALDNDTARWLTATLIVYTSTVKKQTDNETYKQVEAMYNKIFGNK